MMKKRRFISIMIGVIFILYLTFSFTYVSSHIHHHCSGEACPVCEQIHITEKLINSIREITGVLPFLYILLLSLFSISFLNGVSLPCITLVSLKVKLSN